MMILTREQAQAIKDGESVTVSPPEVGAECVVLRADVYARVRQLLFEGAEIDPRSAYPAILRAWDAEGSTEDGDLYRS